MRLLHDIAATWASPAAATGRLLSSGAGEERALGLVMGACAGIFALRLPVLAREASESGGEVPFVAVAAGAAVGLMVFAPLALYGLAALSHLVARVFGGKGSWLGARLVLFWSLVCTLPLVALEALARVLLGTGTLAVVLGLLVFAAFAFLWMSCLHRVEFPPSAMR